MGEIEMKNEQVKVDFNMCFAIPEGICRFPQCTRASTHIASDGRYSENNNICPTGEAVVCSNHICKCNSDRDVYGMVPICRAEVPISWKALAQFVICAGCGKLVFLRKGENAGSLSLGTMFEIFGNNI